MLNRCTVEETPDGRPGPRCGNSTLAHTQEERNEIGPVIDPVSGEAAP